MRSPFPWPRIKPRPVVSASHGQMAWIALVAGLSRLLAPSSVNERRMPLHRRCTLAPSCLLVLSMLVLSTRVPAQSTSKPSEQPAQLPKTAPATENILSSYEGQNVTGVEVAGRPGLDTSKWTPLFQQHAGEPFSRQKVDQSIAALKSAGKFTEVQLQVEPEANGVRVLLIVEPAIWFGIFEFPGAERFPYSRLVQIANYPPQAPFNAGDVQQDSDALLRFFQQQGYFEAEVRPQVDLDTGHNVANVRFLVSLNRRAKFGTVAIANTTPEQAAKMNKSLQGINARVRERPSGRERTTVARP